MQCGKPKKKMNTVLLVSLIGTATVIFCTPLAEDSIYKELATFDAYSDEPYQKNDRRRPFHKEKEKIQILVQSPLSSGTLTKKQDVADLHHELTDIVGIGSKVMNFLGNLVYRLYEKKYGIDDKLLEVLREAAEIFYIGAGLNTVDSYRIDSNVREGIQRASLIVERILSYLNGLLIRKEKLDIRDCKPTDATVAAPDGWAPLFQVLKFNQQNVTCLFFKKAERDNSLTFAEKNMFKSFFDLVMKLYETEYLTDDADKLNLKKLLDYFLWQVNQFNMSQMYKNDVKTLTDVFFKVLTGEQLTFADKAFALKSFFTIYIAGFRGIHVYRNLLFNHHTSVFLTSLSPIAMRIGLTEYIKVLKQRKHVDLNSNTRKILNQLLPMVKNLINAIFQSILNSDGMQQKLFPNMQLKKRISTEQKVAKENSRQQFISQERPDLSTAVEILQLMLADEYNSRIKWHKFVKAGETEQATADIH